MRCISSALACLSALAFMPVATASTQPTLRVTTDSAAYCRELALRFAAQAPPKPEPATLLAEEGERLCEAGHVRLGIAKLRRALRAAQQGG